jgi:hypothetical protein
MVAKKFIVAFWETCIRAICSFVKFQVSENGHYIKKNRSSISVTSLSTREAIQSGYETDKGVQFFSN